MPMFTDPGSIDRSDSSHDSCYLSELKSWHLKPEIKADLALSQSLETLLASSLPKWFPEIFSTQIRSTTCLGANTNQVFLVTDEKGTNLVVRVSAHNILAGDHPDPQTNLWSRYHKEAWASDVASQAGIRTVRVDGIHYFSPHQTELKCSNDYDPSGLVCMVETHVAGKSMFSNHLRYGDPRRQDLYFKVGREVARINSISTKGFGDCFEAGQERFSYDTWEGFIRELGNPKILFDLY